MFPWYRSHRLDIPPKTNRQRAKRWCFTLNDSMEEDVERVRGACTEANCQFAVVGKEVGDSGTPHLQGFVHFKKQILFTAVKKMLGSRGHFEVARGTDEQKDEYCQKGGDIVVRFGDPSTCSGPKGGGHTRAGLAVR